MNSKANEKVPSKLVFDSNSAQGETSTAVSTIKPCQVDTLRLMHPTAIFDEVV